MSNEKTEFLRSARRKLDVAILIVLLLYGYLGYLNYPGNLLVWINMAVMSMFVLSAYVSARRRIGKIIRLIEMDAPSYE